ncbi:MAG: tail fiber domain-containing protein [Bacteroidota bacterium]
MKHFYLKLIYISLIFSLLTFSGNSQNIAVTDDESYVADSSAMLDVKSVTKGLLVPRVTSAQRTSITLPATGLLVYDTDLERFYFYNGAEWKNISAEGIWLVNGDNLYLSDENKRVGIGVSNANSKLEVKADASFGVDDTLFVVKDNAGYPVFAVFPDGAKVFVDQTTKGKVGGFAVSGRTSTKFTEEDYFHITPDSARIYLNEPAKGKVGGFAVSGRTSSKGETTNFLNITPDNYFIGHDVAPNIEAGLRNSVLGYNAGYSLVNGDDNIFIGNKAGYMTGASISGGNENVFIGNEAGYNTTTPVRNVFIGHHAGYNNVTGQYNTYIGNAAGENGTGYYNTIIGGLAATTNDFGDNNVIIGYVAGRDMISSNNIMIGKSAGYNNIATEGHNIYIGSYAGEGIADENYRFEIANDRTKPPLLYGEFDNQRLAINGRTTNDYTFYVNGTASGSSAWGSTSDLRLKTDVQTISNALTKVIALRGVNFKWKDENKFEEGLQMGFIAQEAEKIIPEVVKKGEDNYSMQYAPITAILVEAIKEQQNQIEDLKSENEILKEKLNEIIELLNEKE